MTARVCYRADPAGTFELAHSVALDPMTVRRAACRGGGTGGWSSTAEGCTSPEGRLFIGSQRLVTLAQAVAFCAQQTKAVG